MLNDDFNKNEIKIFNLELNMNVWKNVLFFKPMVNLLFCRF